MPTAFPWHNQAGRRNTEVNVMFKKYTLLLTAVIAATSLTGARAEWPASQFGFKGWPMRKPSVCEPAPENPVKPTFHPGAGENLPTDAPQVGVTATPAPIAPTQAPSQAPSRTPAATPAPTPTAAVTDVPSTDDDYTTQSAVMQEAMMVNLLNYDRNQNGLPSLTVDPALTSIARFKSQDMKDNHYFAHESPTYGRVSDLLKRFGYSFSAAGENIAHHATAEKAHAAFMSSDGHRRNILSSAWEKVGIGVVYDNNGFIYATQIFTR